MSIRKLHSEGEPQLAATNCRQGLMFQRTDCLQRKDEQKLCIGELKQIRDRYARPHSTSILVLRPRLLAFAWNQSCMLPVLMMRGTCIAAALRNTSCPRFDTTRPQPPPRPATIAASAMSCATDTLRSSIMILLTDGPPPTPGRYSSHYVVTEDSPRVPRRAGQLTDSLRLRPC